MKTLYFDFASGVSGDMFVAALLDLGAPLQVVEEGLSRLPVGGYRIQAVRDRRGGLTGTRFDVLIQEKEGQERLADHSGSLPEAKSEAKETSSSDHPSHHSHHGSSHSEHAHKHEHRHGHGHEHAHFHRPYREVRAIIERSGLSPRVKEAALRVFRRLAEAEAKVHGVPVEEVMFHEVGAVDSIVDIVAACLALEALGWPRLLGSVVTDGTGTVRTAHGELSVPVPATVEILASRSIPVQQCAEPHELVTPTGAALIATLVDRFGPMPLMRWERIGYGLGHRENRFRPNVLRVMAGELEEGADSEETSGLVWEEVEVLETNLDDASPELVGALVQRLLAEGALDVWTTSIGMKKQRPGVLLSVLCRPEERDRFLSILFQESTTFGVRESRWERWSLDRAWTDVETRYGAVAIKLGFWKGRIVQAQPEFASCEQVAKENGVSVREVFTMAVGESAKLLGKSQDSVVVRNKPCSGDV